MKRIAGNLALAAGAIVVALLLGELELRALGVGQSVYVWTDPIRGVAHIPGARSRRPDSTGAHIEINSDGMRGPEVSRRAAPGTYRIALLGDSFIEAFEVPYDRTVGEVLERRLAELRGAPVEVLNFGVGGYGTTQEYLTLKHRVWKYSWPRRPSGGRSTSTPFTARPGSGTGTRRGTRRRRRASRPGSPGSSMGARRAGRPRCRAERRPGG